MRVCGIEIVRPVGVPSAGIAMQATDGQAGSPSRPACSEASFGLVGGVSDGLQGPGPARLPAARGLPSARDETEICDPPVFALDMGT
jgi:hypothetical protein